ncbi:glycosyltransferase family 2 protein [Epilithonimonas ginsengisoli]|uniref:Glycosyltransferase family 2 protein n=1 Tax=Epilithonimonas ginsengisoli TaxID=1245592 RepID=A0ABU4JEG7_9FLAO|nr:MULTISPECIES: glycosyltransferase [Chryseobacterium group]MBV6879438.1 glycosyltransferase [Epilithonimonas sp. FP105]MDW8548074.1 glycosyltransferase family 2 protein [Epilithonimonas ginsengisoli]OAH64485.1 glycosyl transferase family 2 [Chryseobacterium sp. FP211-J200]
MKLSICVPVYNFDVNELVNELRYQIDKGLEAEILLIDDASEKSFIESNRDLRSKVGQFIFLDKNIGRSKIRNLFLKYSNSDYLLFLDCDGKVISKNFLKNYIEYIDSKNPDVIFGGRKVSDVKPDSEYGLRWKFATERENLPVEKRVESPYLDFQTNNFVVKRSVLEKVPFNEGITQYGYEDLVFSKDLHDQDIKIDHIDNPIFNNDVETNAVFLAKAEQSARSLAQLIKNDKNFDRVSQIKLAKAYLFMHKTGTIYIYRLLYRIVKSRLEKKLLTGSASLRALDLYKLGQLTLYMNRL